jgi:hypothetical protein
MGMLRSGYANTVDTLKKFIAIIGQVIRRLTHRVKADAEGGRALNDGLGGNF